MNIDHVFKTLNISPSNYGACTGLEWLETTGKSYATNSPVNGIKLPEVIWATEREYEEVIKTAQTAFLTWRKIPAPQRGDIIRQIGEALRIYKQALGTLVTLEMGKSLQEGLGEVQEMIDICDFAVGLSRQLYGLTMHSERPDHRMYEQYHSLGIVGVISAFNFPVAVWSWNTMLAVVCGDVCVWKPSEKTPLTAIACQQVIKEVLIKNNVPEGVFSLIIGDSEIGKRISNDKRIPLVSATGSTRMGKLVSEAVSKRLGKTILELGGNNAVIISEKANLDLAIRAVLFGAVGTCGQRCTTTRRLIVHSSIYNEVKDRLVAAYSKLTIGDPLESYNIVGPLIDKDAVINYLQALEKVMVEGGKLLIGGSVLSGEEYVSGTYVTPAIVEAQNDYEMVQEETFAPILYLLQYTGDVEDAITIQNDVKQGLSSAIFTNDMQEAEIFLSSLGSDCGIANVNIGTSGAEIGGAFGGEKETGGGRESGSDAWKAYMRRQTNTINYGKSLPLAQGINFNI